MTRRQFSVRLAYAMTINKSQGQSIKFIGVHLCTPIFSNGQLYVALSRCTSFDRITVLPLKEKTDFTINIVILKFCCSLLYHTRYNELQSIVI
ncbi:hypothetical protein RHMOL_Rhmol02G0225800 [Rhododendron molle]|nr:hypothetical protein RHMOL_Rhmol02G0225800 [Rhododendron molle]